MIRYRWLVAAAAAGVVVGLAMIPVVLAARLLLAGWTP